MGGKGIGLNQLLSGGGGKRSERFFHLLRRVWPLRSKCLRVILKMDPAEEDYPTEIHDYLSAFETAVGSVDAVLKTMMSVSRSELLQKLDPLEQAKIDLVSAYTLNSMFWVYLATQGINPKEHPVKQELERIRTYMNRVKEIEEKKKAAKLDKGAASRFLRNALYEPKTQSKPTKKGPIPTKKKKTH